MRLRCICLVGLILFKLCRLHGIMSFLAWPMKNCLSDMAECCHKVPIIIKDGPHKGETIFVPCGKCANCLEHKQNEFLVKSYRAALYFGKFWMLTLTYRPEKVHISGCLGFFEEGKCREHSKPFLCDELREVYFQQSPTAQYIDARGRVHSYHKPCWLPVEKADGVDSRMFLMQTYDKKDVQNWIKQMRTTYTRNFGTLPEFKYVICPEYGGLTLRPHFHVCIYGLPAKTVYWMRSLWNKKYGFCDVKEVKLDYKGEDGFGKMSMYVSKYVSKGMFEVDCVREGFAFKPRITCSRFLGLESSEDFAKLRQWHLAFDVGKKAYKVSRPFVNPRIFVDQTTGETIRVVSPASEDVKLIERICDRMFINLNGFKYPMPKTFKNVIYGQYDNVKKRFTASELSDAIASFLQARAAEDLQRQLAAFGLDDPRTADPVEVCRLTNDFLFGKKNDVSRAVKRLKKFYERSKVM